MAVQVDPKALVNPKAHIGEGTVVGPYATIDEHVTIGPNCRIDSFAQVLGHTRIGEGTRIFSYAVIGNIPQDLKYKGDITYLEVGKNNKIREFVTINPGTEGGSKTVVGDSNLLMAYAHVAHDCLVGNNNILANNATLAGYVVVGNNVVIGGLAAIHQFCRMGDYAIIGGCSKAVQDIPPYSMSDGHPALICGINIVGMRRAGFSRETIQSIRKASKILFHDKHSLDKAVELVKKSLPASAEIQYLLDFVSSTKRGINK
jgi:UDP-N-acetylglucosamine acyltransferase